jgi:hypothetical protein
VTLSGCIEYEHQRNAAVQAARHLDGVTRVVDQLRVKPKTSPWKMEPTKPAPAPVAPIAPPVEEPPKADEAADPHLAENAAALSGTA